MSNFRTLNDAQLAGQRALVRVDLNVPMEKGEVSDATRIDRASRTLKEISDKGGKVIVLSHFGRPKGRDAKELAEAAGRRAVARRRPPGRLCRRLHRRCGRQGRRRDEGRRHSAAREHPLSCGRGKERQGLRRRAGQTRRSLRQRRLLRRAPRPCLDRGPWRHVLPAYRRPQHGRRTDRAGKGARQAEEAGHRHCRRRQGLDQARPSGKSRHQGRCAGHRRRHGQHLPARAGHRHRQVAGANTISPTPRAASWPRRRRRSARSFCRSMPWSPTISRPTRPRMPTASTRSRPTA